MTSPVSPPSSTSVWSLFTLSFRNHLYLSFLLRLGLIYYGDHQDSTSVVKFTDVDYRVFTDAARHVSYGESPYLRHTYRYTPLLAWMLYPNITLSPFFGKLLFCSLDLVAGWLIYANVRAFHNERQSRAAAFFWLYNPFVFTVSARGNAESVVVSIVLLALHLFRERVFFLSGLAYGLAVHFKIYPAIYSIAFFLALSRRRGWRSLFEVNAPRLLFVAGAVLTFVVTTALCYHAYGQEFLDNAYFYHITRKDTRHNFSPYFYMLYLTAEEDDVGISVLTFLPQIILLVALAFKFGNPKELSFCLFCQTVVFVTYNKVVTSQYFLWYLSLLPLSLPKLNLTKREALTWGLVWIALQAFWLLFAYNLEFRGSNTFQLIWIECLGFFMANVSLLSKLIRTFREESRRADSECNIDKLD